MYKKLTIEELCKTNTQFFGRLKMTFGRERYPDIKSFLKNAFKFGNDIHYLNRGDPSFSIFKRGVDHYTLIDEREKVEIDLDKDALNVLHNFMKNDKNIKKLSTIKSVEEQLFAEYEEGTMRTINGKPYVVYDIETTGSSYDLKQQRFCLAYAFVSDNEEKTFSSRYRYISKENLLKFINYLVEFDGYIIGFNHVGFDNPVMIYNADLPEETIKILNKKSLDIFLFLRNMTGRKISLNKVSTSLIGVEKTLSSGEEGSKLLAEFEKTGDEKILKKVKDYCKNDVKMTLGVLLYLLKYKKIHHDDEEIDFTEDDFYTQSQAMTREAAKEKEVVEDDGGRLW